MKRNIILMLFAFIFSVNTTFAENKSGIEGNQSIEMQQSETESIKVELLENDDEQIKESLINNFATTYQKCFTQSDFNMVIAFLRTKSVEEVRMITSSFSGIDPNTTQIVSIFLGAYGVDRFMLGQNTYGALKLITFGGCGIWAIIDWFQIKKLTKETNIKNFAEITNMNQFALTQQGYYPPVQQAPPIQQQVERPTKRKQLAKEEPRKEVEGYGNTALENTIIRWDVQSRPAGADVFWRVVSKTPEVKSTNNKYLQTTPYEATKSLDIRGLSYENSGDVRIILRCEKEGYYPQEKEFNVRMIIDQEEISAFFRLVKEE